MEATTAEEENLIPVIAIERNNSWAAQLESDQWIGQPGLMFGRLMAQEWAIKQRQQQLREGNRHRVVHSVCGRRIKIVAGKLAINEQQAEANQGIIRSESVNFSSVSA